MYAKQASLGSFTGQGSPAAERQTEKVQILEGSLLNTLNPKPALNTKPKILNPKP